MKERRKEEMIERRGKEGGKEIRKGIVSSRVFLGTLGYFRVF